VGKPAGNSVSAEGRKPKVALPILPIRYNQTAEPEYPLPPLKLDALRGIVPVDENQEVEKCRPQRLGKGSPDAASHLLFPQLQSVDGGGFLP
jgi:hypothetical protein